MRSIIIYHVEHGETTDPLSELFTRFDEAVQGVRGVEFVNSTVRVDLPPCFVLDSSS